MSYVALYRKFRPDNFADVKGQDAIVTTLKNQIISDRLSHAYLFCGTRGTGKTTVAKLLAKTVNCEHPIDGNPCGECASCRAIAQGASMSVTEIDAASNNGVDNVRQIIEEVQFPPADAKFRVYIIDEVHMLSAGAFNALLKTLEEPPSYCIFILATTDPQKVPITILSRCQRYDFKRITIDTIALRLEELTALENIKVEPRALRYIAKVADGSMRDALSLLDQCIAFHYGEVLTFEQALDVLGAVDTEVFSRMFRALLTQDLVYSIRVIDEVVAKGRELGQFVTDFTWYLRNVLVAGSTDKSEDILDISAENMERLLDEADLCEPQILIRYIRAFSTLANEIRYSPQKRVLIEMAIIKLCKPQMETTNEALLDRIRALEMKLEGVDVKNAAQAAEKSVASVTVADEPSGDRAPLPKAVTEDIYNLINNWDRIINEADNNLKPYVKLAIRPTTNPEGTELMLVCKTLRSYENLKGEKHFSELKEVFANALGKDVDFTLLLEEDAGQSEAIFPDILKLKGIDIEIIKDNDKEEDGYV